MVQDKRIASVVLFGVLALALALVLALAGQARSGESGPTGVVVMDSLADRFSPVEFDHGMHTGLAESCGQCHHTHGSDNGRCADCHTLDANAFRQSATGVFMACGACHAEALEPEAPEMPSLQVALHGTCYGCHREMGMVEPGPEGCTSQCHTAALAR
jgi:hypothetical protein